MNVLAIGYTAPYLESILSPTALKQYEVISQYLSRKWDEDSALHPQLWEWNGCLEKLATAILQIERLSNHQNHLLTQAINNIIGRNASDAVFLASEVSLDFESLLLQGRAALDRLTNFISRHYGNYTDRFSKLQDVLQHSKKDENTDTILRIFEDVKWFEGTLMKDNLGENLGIIHNRRKFLFRLLHSKLEKLVSYSI